MARYHALVAGGALLGAIVGSVVTTGPLGVLAGLLVLATPGLAVAQAAVPGRMERVAWAVTAEFVALIACGLVLAQFSAVTRAGWLWSLATVTVIASGVSTLRLRGRASAADPARKGDRRQTWLLTAAGAGTTLILAGAIAISVQSSRDVADPPFSELWMLPTGNGHSVAIGVRNHEGESVRYRLTVAAQGRTLRTWSIVVHRGAQWRGESTVPPGRDVIARLYRTGHDAAYRTVTVAAEVNSATVVPTRTP